MAPSRGSYEDLSWARLSGRKPAARILNLRESLTIRSEKPEHFALNTCTYFLTVGCRMWWGDTFEMLTLKNFLWWP